MYDTRVFAIIFTLIMVLVLIGLMIYNKKKHGYYLYETRDNIFIKILVICIYILAPILAIYVINNYILMGALYDGVTQKPILSKSGSLETEESISSKSGSQETEESISSNTTKNVSQETKGPIEGKVQDV